jgi:hypothetical protein
VTAHDRALRVFPHWRSPVVIIMEPLTFEEWCSDTDIEAKYEAFHDEYGDAAAPLWEYKQVHYEEYLADFEREHRKLDE